LGGTDARRWLQSLSPLGFDILAVNLAGVTAHIDLSAAFLDGNTRPDLAKAAVIETMTALPGVTSVALSVEGNPVVTSANRTALLYYASPNGLVAVPTSISGPRAALGAYLSGPGDPELAGFPADVQLLSYG